MLWLLGSWQCSRHLVLRHLVSVVWHVLDTWPAQDSPTVWSCLWLSCQCSKAIRMEISWHFHVKIEAIHVLNTVHCLLWSLLTYIISSTSSASLTGPCPESEAGGGQQRSHALLGVSMGTPPTFLGVSVGMPPPSKGCLRASPHLPRGVQGHPTFLGVSMGIPPS